MKRQIIESINTKVKYYDDSTIINEIVKIIGNEKITTKEIETNKTTKKNTKERKLIFQKNIVEYIYNDSSSIIKNKFYKIDYDDGKPIKILIKETSKTIKTTKSIIDNNISEEIDDYDNI